MQINLCINNPNNGNPMRQLWAIQFGNVIHLESNFVPDPGVTCYRCDDNHVKIGRRKFPIRDYVYWIGNWCWDGIEVDIEIANDILAYIQSMHLHDRQKFGIEEALTEIFDVYERGEKIDLGRLQP